MSAIDIGTLIVSILILPLVISDHGARLVQSLLNLLLGLIFRNASWCDSLQWADVPDGPLHLCGFMCQYQSDSIHVSGSRRCWESLLRSTLNLAWGRRHVRALRRPLALGLTGQRYIKTDAKTVLSVMLVNSRTWGGGEGVFDRTFISGGGSNLRYRDLGDFLSAHLKSTAISHCTSYWTKKECDMILQGYPPYYQESLVLYANGGLIPYPDMSNGGIRRGGWVVAVALSPRHPTRMYITQSTGDVAFHPPCCRVRDVVARVISPAFPGSTSVSSALACLTRMCRYQTGSGYEDPIACDDLRKSASECLFRGILSARDCVFAVSLFDHLDPLTQPQISRLRPLLVPILAAAIVGVRDVYQYVNNEGVRMNKEMSAFFQENRTIFLGDCYK